jgi:hypothetical protein
MPREQLIAKPADIEWEDPKVKDAQNGFPMIKCEPMRSFSSILEKLFNVVVDKCERPYSFVGRKMSKKPISTIQNAGTGFTKMVRGRHMPGGQIDAFPQDIGSTLVTFWHKSDIVQPDVEFQQEGRAIGNKKTTKKTSKKIVFTRRQHGNVILLREDNIYGFWQIADETTC